MASHPPFQVEDQNDEDFFDKLVNDDDDDDIDFKATTGWSATAGVGSSYINGNESDEAKAFANLSIGEVKSNERIGNNYGYDNGEMGLEVDGEVRGGGGGGTYSDAKAEVSATGDVEETCDSLVAGDLYGLDTTIESNNGNFASEASSECTMISKSSGSGGSGVKEVGWNAFNTDSSQDNTNGFGSYSDFFTGLGENTLDSVSNVAGNVSTESKVIPGGETFGSSHAGNSSSYAQYQAGSGYGATTEQGNTGEDVKSSEYWEKLYPGWKFDPATGQWYQVDGYAATANTQGNLESNSISNWSADGKSEVSYLQQAAQSAAGMVAESGRTESVTCWNQVSQLVEASETTSDWNQSSQGTENLEIAPNWNQVSQVNSGYPSHMVFDPQYPGWYYDTIAQEWHSLDSYTASAQSATRAHDQLNQTGVATNDSYTHNDVHTTYSDQSQVNNYTSSQGFSSHSQGYNWGGSFDTYSQQSSSKWEPVSVARNELIPEYSRIQQLDNQHARNLSDINHLGQLKANEYVGSVSNNGKGSQGQNEYSVMNQTHSFVSGGNFSQQFDQPRPEQTEQKHFSNDYFGNQNSASFPQQSFQASQQYSYSPTSVRSSAGRPPHALVTFGFGGKLIVMKDNASLGNFSFPSQNSVGCTVSVLNMSEVIAKNADVQSLQPGSCDYFHALCRQPFPGPLSSGNFGMKDLNKWIDERISSSESPDMDFRKGNAPRLLLSLLRIACQYYGKLRSPFGSDPMLKENDLPESAVAKLFASAKRNAAQYGAVAHCLQSFPSEAHIRATAAEVQSLLVSGRKKEALLCAQEGQLWGPALVLAAQLGDQFYVDTVKQMALRQLVAGSPLRTLCLLIAGQPADVFSMDTTASGSMPGVMNPPQQSAQFGVNGMLEDWEENLAVIAANRTKDDELVLIHLGDCLWRERSDIFAAHICYLVAEANFEPYSDSARLCLVGADHLKFPRTYASPEAIQRTEIYEYSKFLGNSQFILLPFQPYKLVYAHMLAEVGRISDSLKYCQAVLKSLKIGRFPEEEKLRDLVTSLEARIKTHQQGEFSTNSASAKIVGKLLNLFDSTANLVIGLPPPIPSMSGSSAQGHERPHPSTGPRVSTSQSTMAMSSLMPSESVEPISEWAGDGSRRPIHNRSVSEPDFGRSPRKEASSTSGQSKAASRFGRFGFGSQFLQKTVGLVLKTRQDRQAKLGESNKFYYDEKLKRWVEEGAEPFAEEVAPPPPPKTAAFQNGIMDYNLKNASKNDGSLSNGSPEYKSQTPAEHSSGMPPLPPTSNQFSARGRMGVRSRYVDTFNQGGGNPTNLFQSPSVSSARPAAGTNPKFFVPTPVSAAEQPVDHTPHNVEGSSANDENPSVSAINDSIPQPASSSSVTMQRFPSMDNISSKGPSVGNSSFSTHSRRTASWSGSFHDSFSPTKRSEIKPLGEVLGMPPSSFMPNDSPLVHSSVNDGSFGDDLHEVEL